MTNPRLLAALLLICLWLMAGCEPATPEQSGANQSAAPVAPAQATPAPLATAAPAPTDTPESAPESVAAATEQPTPADTPEPAPDWTQTASLVDGLYVLGNPNAAIRAIDYSDFF